MISFFCLFKLKLITLVEPQDTLLEKPYTFNQAKVAFYLNINPKFTSGFSPHILKNRMVEFLDITWATRLPIRRNLSDISVLKM